MANDKWQFAKIDVNLLMNPKWFQVERSIRDQMQSGDETRLPIEMGYPLGNPMGTPMGGLMGRVRYALLEAQQLHLASILYSVQFLTDGVFPVGAIKSIVHCENEEAVTALFEVGMWSNLPGGMAEIHDFLKHQTSSKTVKKAAEDGKKYAQKRWEKSDGSPNGVPNGSPNGSPNGNKNKNKNKREGKQESRKRASRIPENFTVDSSMRSWAAQKTPDVDLELSTEKFINYWTAASGAKATKLDWVATWRNWMLSDQERAPKKPVTQSDWADMLPVVGPGHPRLED